MTSASGTEEFRCFACGRTHAGSVFREGGALFARIECPRLGVRDLLLSSDAALFESLRQGVRTRTTTRRYQFALLHITDRCRMRCPTCFAESGDGVPLPFDAVMRLARQTVGRGVRKLALTGGEPAEHPDILRIVRSLSRELGCSVSLLTNGQRLAEEPGFALSLKRAGLRKIHISFDTLVPETSVRMRGGNYVELKQRAFTLASAARLATAANVTVSELNLPEVGALFRHLASTVPGLSHVLFQPQCSLGRGTATQRIDRERVIRELAGSPDFPLDDVHAFIPMPRIPAFGIDVHPDCGAMAAVLVRGEGAEVSLRALDSDGRGWTLARRLAAIDGRPGLLSSARALWAWMRHAGPAGALLLNRWWRGGAGPHVVLAVVDNLPDVDFMLEDRIRRCCSGVVCGNGGLDPVCAGYRTGRRGGL